MSVSKPIAAMAASCLLMSVAALAQTGVTAQRAADPADIRMLDIIAKAAARGTGLVQQIVGFARGIGGKRERTLPGVLGSILRGRQTPWLATIAVAVVSLGLFIGSNYIGSVGTILGDAIDAIGIQICVYYGLAGLTVVVAYRKVLFAAVKNFLMIGLWPLAGAAFMFWILGESVSSNLDDAVVNWVALGGLAIGFIPLVIYWPMGSPYFRQRPTLGSVDLAIVTAAADGD